MSENLIPEDILKSISLLSSSIMLVGSHANNSAHNLSDIDLVIICDNLDNNREIKKLIPKRKLVTGRQRMDCKVFTQDEFNTAKVTGDHRFLWSCMQRAICLFGKDISKDIQLNPNLIMNNLWSLVNQIEEVNRLLDYNVQFSGCCFHLFNAAETVYFARKYILRNIPNNLNKDTFIQSVFCDQTSLIYDRYYWVVSKLDTTSKKTLQIKTKTDSNYSSDHYGIMQEKAEKVLMILKQVVVQINDIFEKL